MTDVEDEQDGYSSPVALSPDGFRSEDFTRLPKNKSTGNLLRRSELEEGHRSTRIRFSFDAGTIQEMNTLAKSVVQPQHVITKRSH